MNNKLEKFYNYIINDMVKNTYPQDNGVVLPYFPNDIYSYGWLSSEKFHLTHKNDFGEYVYEKYGVYSNEWKELYLRYLEVIL